MPPEQADTIARELARAGFPGLFMAGDRSSAADVWSGGDNRDALREIVRGEGYGDLERVLASEVLFAHDDAHPPGGWEDTLGKVYARALELTGSGDRPIVLMGNLWGVLYYGDETGAGDDGALGTHLLAAGPAAVPHLIPLMDDTARIVYEGSREATLGNSFGYRVKDAAAYFIGKLTGIAVAFHDDPAERDAEIERVKAEVGTRG